MAYTKQGFPIHSAVLSMPSSNMVLSPKSKAIVQPFQPMDLNSMSAESGVWNIILDDEFKTLHTVLS